MKNTRLIITILLTMLTKLHCFQGGSPTSDCINQMNSYRACMKNGLYNNGKEKLTSQEKQKLHDEIEKCFLNEKCKSPFLSNSYREAAKVCLLKARNESRKELENCVRKDQTFNDFQLPQDESDNFDNVNAISLLIAGKNLNAYCPFWSNKNRLMNCVGQKSNDSQTKVQKSVDVCKIRQKCNSTVTSVCLTKWTDQSVPAICRCINDGSSILVQKYQKMYENCLKQKSVDIQPNDPVEKLLESYIKGWCPSKAANKRRCSNASKPVQAPKSAASRSGPPKSQLVKPPVKPVKNFEEETTTPINDEVPIANDEETTQEVTETSSQNFFDALSADPVFQNIIGNNPALNFLANLFSGKTDLSSFFTGTNLLGDFQGGVGNIFGNFG